MIDPQPGAPTAPPLPLVQLGYSAAFQTAFAHVAEADHVPARVVAVHRDRLVVAGADGEFTATLDTHLVHAGSLDRPASGDWIVLRLDPAGGSARVCALLPRRTAFIRAAAGKRAMAQVVAANIDRVLVVSALPTDLNERRLERYLVLAWESGAVPMIVLTKCDLVDDAAGYVATVRALAPGVDVLAVSASDEGGITELASLLTPGETVALLGSSGVGKSTLVNRLAGESVMRTSEVDVDGRGRHTTTHRELIRLPSGVLVIDTPGMRELQLWSADAGLDQVFEEVVELGRSCRFADCGHTQEPGCAVTAAVANGQLSAERLASWRKLVREMARARLQQDAVASSAERARLRAMMRAVRANAKSRDK